MRTTRPTLHHQGGYASFPQPEQPDDSYVVDVKNLETYLQRKRASGDPAAEAPLSGAAVMPDDSTVVCPDWTRPLAAFATGAAPPRPITVGTLGAPHRCGRTLHATSLPAQLSTYMCHTTSSWTGSAEGARVLEVLSAGGESTTHGVSPAPFEGAMPGDFVTDSKDASSSGDEGAEHSRLPRWLRSAGAAVHKSLSGQWRPERTTRCAGRHDLGRVLL